MQISLSCAVTKQITAVEACHIVSLSGGLAAHRFGFISVALVLVVTAGFGSETLKCCR